MADGVYKQAKPNAALDLNDNCMRLKHFRTASIEGNEKRSRIQRRTIESEEPGLPRLEREIFWPHEPVVVS